MATTITETLTDSEILAAQQQAEQIVSSITIPVVQPNQFVFFAAFDGTNNDVNNLSLSGDPQTFCPVSLDLNNNGREMFSNSTNNIGYERRIA